MGDIKQVLTALNLEDILYFREGSRDSSLSALLPALCIGINLIC
jgi:hypothetical protein